MSAWLKLAWRFALISFVSKPAMVKTYIIFLFRVVLALVTGVSLAAMLRLARRAASRQAAASSRVSGSTLMLEQRFLLALLGLGVEEEEAGVVAVAVLEGSNCPCRGHQCCKCRLG